MTPATRTPVVLGTLLTLGLAILMVVAVVRTPATMTATSNTPPPTPATTLTASSTTSDSSSTTSDSSMPREWPTPESTGTRLETSALTSSDSITTSFDGQVIEGQDVIGRIEIRHDDVTIRDTRIQYTTNYGVLIEKVNGVCPKGTMIEYVEIDGSRAADNHAPAYDEGCGYTFDHVYLHNAGSGIRVYGPSVITNSYLVNDTYGPSGAHREPLVVYGSDKVIRNNVLICDVPPGGCSAALAIYGQVYPPQNILVEGNWLAATAAYCAYGGATHEYSSQAVNIDFFDNAFSVSLTPETSTCGRSGNITAHRNGADGNQRAGNYIYETGRSID